MGWVVFFFIILATAFYCYIMWPEWDGTNAIQRQQERQLFQEQQQADREAFKREIIDQMKLEISNEKRH